MERKAAEFYFANLTLPYPLGAIYVFVNWTFMLHSQLH